ncbi:MAG: hypothetical protein RLZZ337_236 [Bacteroidota bacterium]
MKLSDFDIDFIKFNNETDVFDFKLNDLFFGLKENSLFEKCDLQVTVNCEKKESTVKIVYSITGTVSTQCERCLEDIQIEINPTTEEVLKITSNTELLATEYYLSATHQVYNIYDSLYEQICVAMPLRKICKNSLTKKKCEITYTNTETDTPVDARWDKLKSLIK